MSSHCRVAKACLFGGTLLAAGLAHADGVTLVQSPSSGIYGYARAMAYNRGLINAYGADSVGLGVSYSATLGFAYAHAQTSPTLLRVQGITTAPYGGSYSYVLGFGSATQYFQVSTALTAQINWDARTNTFGAQFSILLWNEADNAWNAVQNRVVSGTAGSESITFEADVIYWTFFTVRAENHSDGVGAHDTWGEFDFAPESIPLPSAAALALAGLGMVGVRRRR